MRLAERILMCMCLQVVAREESADANQVRMGALAGLPQGQLDGFKSRVLRAESPAQRDLYATQWCARDVTEVTNTAMLVVGDGELFA